MSNMSTLSLSPLVNSRSASLGELDQLDCRLGDSWAGRLGVGLYALEEEGE